MKIFLFAAAITLSALPSFAADVGVSISVGEPGFYGRLDIGNFPHPPLIYPTPIIIQPGVAGHPAYLRVPPGHQKNWRKHCHKYNACGQPVYFVQESWYHNEYAPRYREKHGKHGGGGKGGHEKGGKDKDKKGKHGKD